MNAMQRMARPVVIGLITLGAFVVTACTDNPQHEDYHLCSWWDNDEWSGLPSIGIDHVDPGNCDIDKDPNGMGGGGTVYQNSGVTYPNQGRFLKARLRIYDTYVTMSFTGSTLLASDTENFGWSDIDGRWEVPLYAFYTPGLNPDYLEFQLVHCNPSCGTDPYPTAVMEVTYAGEPE